MLRNWAVLRQSAFIMGRIIAVSKKLIKSIDRECKTEAEDDKRAT